MAITVRAPKTEELLEQLLLESRKQTAALEVIAEIMAAAESRKPARIVLTLGVPVQQ
jgi:hypothetical protein